MTRSAAATAIASSLQQWVYEQVLDVNIGDNTEAQMLSKKLTTIDAGISGGVPDEDKLLPGDLLYFRGTDPDRKATGYVGHVEMYVGNGELSGLRLRRRTDPQEHEGILSEPPESQCSRADL